MNPVTANPTRQDAVPATTLALDRTLDSARDAARDSARDAAGERSRRDERDALADFDAVVREHQRGIFRLLLGWTRDAERADALAQETFLRAWRHRDGFRGDAAVGTWLRRIAIHVAEDDRRSRRQGFWRRILRRAAQDEGEGLDSVPQTAPSAERSLLGRERLDAVWRAVGDLPARQQQVFRLRHLGDLPLREIADALGLAEGTVKVHLSRATHAIRAAVAASEDAAKPQETHPWDRTQP